jgi:hypothetical protein
MFGGHTYASTAYGGTSQSTISAVVGFVFKIGKTIIRSSTKLPALTLSTRRKPVTVLQSKVHG